MPKKINAKKYSITLYSMDNNEVSNTDNEFYIMLSKYITVDSNLLIGLVDEENFIENDVKSVSCN